MQLIGMLDSPYVRRVAISLRVLDIPFEHRPVSVFSTFNQFQHINPVVKAPTLVTDDGTVLMDSQLILDYLENVVRPGHSLMPTAAAARTQALRLIGLALAGCEKTVQIVYEHNLRPAEKQHAPWLERVEGQLRAAFTALEQEVSRHPLPADGSLNQAGITLAVAWQFNQMLLPDVLASADHPALQAYSDYAEQLPAFVATPAA